MDASAIVTAAIPHLTRMRGIDGWLRESEAMALFSLAMSIESPDPAVVEIGSFAGKSSVMIAGGLDGRGTLYCVDPFDSTNQQMYLDVTKFKKWSSLLGRFKSNTWAYPNIVPVAKFSNDAARDESIPLDLDMLFIDGNHNYEAVKADVDLWVGSLKTGGILAMHDHLYSDPGVLRLVKDYGIGLPENGWAKTVQIDSLLITQRTEAPWTTLPSSQ